MKGRVVWLGVAVVLGAAALAAVDSWVMLRWHCAKLHQPQPPPGKPGFVGCRSGELVPISKLAGPARSTEAPQFVLNATNSQRMAGSNDLPHERWCDIAGNYYSSGFVQAFSYTRTDPQGPEVRLRVDPRGATFRGRLEAHHLKPNFVYQIKLRGVWADRESFEAIGYQGRWLIPGGGTNWSDDQYRNCAEKEKVEAYIYFDYLLTDRRGNAARDFALDSSLHITWNATRQRGDAQIADLFPAVVWAVDPANYAQPKTASTVELLWNERETSRYDNAGQITRLPPRAYQAELSLVEETFHSRDADGGFWPTVYVAPVSFTVVGAEAPVAAPAK